MELNIYHIPQLTVHYYDWSMLFPSFTYYICTFILHYDPHFLPTKEILFNISVCVCMYIYKVSLYVYASLNISNIILCIYVFLIYTNVLGYNSYSSITLKLYLIF